MRFLSTTVFSFSLHVATLASARGSILSERDGDIAVEEKWLGHDEIKPFQQAKADGLEGDLEEHFKPWLNNGAGCYPYAAVDIDGYHGGGLDPGGESRSQCRDAGNQGGQIYSRVGTSTDGRTGILYSWYIPKVQTDSERHRHFYMSVVVWVYTSECAGAAAETRDYQAVGISYSKGSAVDAWDLDQPLDALYTVGDDGEGNTHAIIGYYGGVDVFPADNSEEAISAPMISWSQLSLEAQAQFNGVEYEHARCPFNDNNFQVTLDAAYIPSLYDEADLPDPGCGSETIGENPPEPDYVEDPPSPAPETVTPTTPAYSGVPTKDVEINLGP